MMMNLFSMFDTQTYYMIPMVGVIAVVLKIVSSNLNDKVWNNAVHLMKSLTGNKMQTEFKSEFDSMKKKVTVTGGPTKEIKNISSAKFFLVLLVIVFLLNFFSLFPTVFSCTSHISVSATLTTVLWTSIIWMSVSKDSINLLSHITPSGTPIALMSFMVCIETISSIIRPLTLAVRLTANLVAGHLLLFLLGKLMIITAPMSTLCVPAMIVLSILEMMVSFIQGYVITLLSVLYFKENF